jgi:hypothetical protein
MPDTNRIRILEPGFGKVARLEGNRYWQAV